MSYLIITVLSMIVGFFGFIGFICYRAMRSDGWDQSNVTNVLRVIAHLATHPEDFGKMYYEDGSMPFWYIKYDELSDVVRTRPGQGGKYESDNQEGV